MHLKLLDLLHSEHGTVGQHHVIGMSQAMQITDCVQKPISTVSIAKVVSGKVAVCTTCEHNYLAARQNKRIRDLVFYNYHFPLELLDM